MYFFCSKKLIFSLVRDNLIFSCILSQWRSLQRGEKEGRDRTRKQVISLMSSLIGEVAYIPKTSFDNQKSSLALSPRYKKMNNCFLLLCMACCFKRQRRQQLFLLLLFFFCLRASCLDNRACCNHGCRTRVFFMDQEIDFLVNMNERNEIT